MGWFLYDIGLRHERVKELSNSSDDFLRLSGFSDLFGKVFLITFKFSFFEVLTTFLLEQCK